MTAAIGNPVDALDLLDALTASTVKREVYRVDPYFREAASVLASVWGHDALPTMLHDLVLVVFKPETIVTRRVECGVAYLRQHGFEPVWLTPFAYSRHMNRAAWRYQYQSDLPSVDRLVVSDMVMSASPSLCVVFRDAHGIDEAPATVRAGHLKGSMSPDRREKGQLRSIVAGPNRMLSGVHMPDEPADIVREIGILFDAHRLRDVAAILRTPVTAAAVSDQLARDLAALYAGQRRVDLDASAALARLTAAVLEVASSPARRDLEELLDTIGRGSPLPWATFIDALERADITLALWDRIILGTTYIEHDGDSQP